MGTQSISLDFVDSLILLVEKYRIKHDELSEKHFEKEGNWVEYRIEDLPKRQAYRKELNDSDEYKILAGKLEHFEKTDMAKLVALMALGRHQNNFDINNQDDWNENVAEHEIAVDEGTTIYLLEKTPLAQYFENGVNILREKGISL
jgi:hypothetical protein